MCIYLAPLRSAGLQTKFSVVRISAPLANNPTGKGENWFRDQIATNTGSAPHFSHTLAPLLPASLSVTSGGRVSVYIPGRQIIRLLLLPDIKNIRQAGRADTNPLLETAGNHFRQVNPPPLHGQFGTRKRVASPGGCPDIF